MVISVFLFIVLPFLYLLNYISSTKGFFSASVSPQLWHRAQPPHWPRRHWSWCRHLICPYTWDSLPSRNPHNFIFSSSFSFLPLQTFRLPSRLYPSGASPGPSFLALLNYIIFLFLCIYINNKMSVAMVSSAASPPNNNNPTNAEGLRRYLEVKVEQLQRAIAEKTQNKRRLEAQRNELNAKGEMQYMEIYTFYPSKIKSLLIYLYSKIYYFRSSVLISLSNKLLDYDLLSYWFYCSMLFAVYVQFENWGKKFSCCWSRARTWGRWWRWWAETKCWLRSVFYVYKYY